MTATPLSPEELAQTREIYADEERKGVRLSDSERAHRLLATITALQSTIAELRGQMPWKPNHIHAHCPACQQHVEFILKPLQLPGRPGPENAVEEAVLFSAHDGSTPGDSANAQDSAVRTSAPGEEQQG